MKMGSHDKSLGKINVQLPYFMVEETNVQKGLEQAKFTQP